MSGMEGSRRVSEATVVTGSCHSFGSGTDLDVEWKMDRLVLPLEVGCYDFTSGLEMVCGGKSKIKDDTQQCLMKVKGLHWEDPKASGGS